MFNRHLGIVFHQILTLYIEAFSGLGGCLLSQFRESIVLWTQQNVMHWCLIWGLADHVRNLAWHLVIRSQIGTDYRVFEKWKLVKVFFHDLYVYFIRLEKSLLWQNISNFIEFGRLLHLRVFDYFSFIYNRYKQVFLSQVIYVMRDRSFIIFKLLAFGWWFNNDKKGIFFLERKDTLFIFHVFGEGIIDSILILIFTVLQLFLNFEFFRNIVKPVLCLNGLLFNFDWLVQAFQIAILVSSSFFRNFKDRLWLLFILHDLVREIASIRIDILVLGFTSIVGLGI